MGDGESGLALAIFVAIAGMVVVGFGLFFALGWMVGKRAPQARGQRLLIASAAGLVGIGVAVCVVAATFFESSWSPPPRIRMDVPPGFDQPWVILLEDASAPRRLGRRGTRLPFHGQSANVQVPRGGVIRVRNLGQLPSGGDTTIVWSDGASATGFTGGSAPAGLHATRFVAYSRQLGAEADSTMLPDGDALVRYVRQRGADAAPLSRSRRACPGQGTLARLHHDRRAPWEATIRIIQGEPAC